MTKNKHEIKIRKQTPDYLIESIEERLDCFTNQAESLKEEYEKKIKEVQKKAEEMKDFWAENKLPIYDWLEACRRRDSIKDKDLYITKTAWKIWDALNVNTWEKHSGHACVHCGKEPISREVCYSDSRFDERFACCDCEGARKNGEKWTEVKKRHD